MDDACLVGGHGEGGAADHALEHVLLHGAGEIVFHVGQLREVVGAEAQDVEICVAAGDGDHHFVVGFENDHIVGHFADDVAEQAGVEDDGAVLGDVGLEPGADAQLHIVAADGQIAEGSFQQQALKGRDGAFGRNSPGSGVDGALQKGFFTGKFHKGVTFFPRDVF